MARNYEEERKLHQKIIDDNKGNKEIEEAQKAHIDKINKDEEKSKAKAEKKAKYEANLDANDAGEKAVEFQNRMVNGDSVKDEPKAEPKAEKTFVDNSDEGIAKAKVGDYIKRNNGEEYQLQQADIDWAKNNIEPTEDTSTVESTANEIINQEPKVEQDLQIEAQNAANVENPENPEAQIGEELTDEQKAHLMESDEGQVAQEAIDSKDPTKLLNIVTPTGEAVLKGSFDANGHYVPYRYTDKDVGGMDKGKAGALTVISMALSALGAMFGIPIVPINFYHLFGKPEAVEQANQIEKDYETVINGETSNKVNAENTRAVNREQNLADVEAYKDVTDEEAQKMAQINAAGQGSNAQLDVQKSQQDFEREMKQLDMDFQKEMNNLNTQSQLDVLKQQGINQQTLEKMMEDHAVTKALKQIEFAKQKGFNADQFAQWMRANGGQTTLQAYLGPAIQAAGSLGAMFGFSGGSDKNIKKYVASNSKMLMNAWKRK